MTQLVEALKALGLNGQVELGGRWVALDGQRCKVYIVEERWGNAYFAWCDEPQNRTVEYYSDPITAIKRGLERAAAH